MQQLPDPVSCRIDQTMSGNPSPLTSAMNTPVGAPGTEFPLLSVPEYSKAKGKGSVLIVAEQFAVPVAGSMLVSDCGKTQLLSTRSVANCQPMVEAWTPS